ncbi:MAG: hypothetical protein HC850_05845, partial [Rhodomicrobium sp.]|nr:hypothetical protein [Rhodomicrobium sp.]
MQHTIHSHQRHFAWDKAIAPVFTVAPGDSLAFEMKDAWDGQLGPGSTAADLAQGDPGRVNPVTGPIAIDGAEPGDILTVTIDAYRPPYIPFHLTTVEFFHLVHTHLTAEGVVAIKCRQNGQQFYPGRCANGHIGP